MFGVTVMRSLEATLLPLHAVTRREVGEGGGGRGRMTSAPAGRCKSDSWDAKICTNKSLTLFLFLCRVASQSELELTEALYINDNDANRLLKDKASRNSAKDVLDQTVHLQSRSNISWELLVKSFNLTTEELELR